MILEEGEFVDEPIMAEEVQRPEVETMLKFLESRLSLGLLQLMGEG